MPREEDFDDPSDDEFDFMMPGEDEEDEEEDAVEESVPMLIGFFGFNVGHEFTFLYDFGDSNLMCAWWIFVNARSHASNTRVSWRKWAKRRRNMGDGNDVGDSIL